MTGVDVLARLLKRYGVEACRVRGGDRTDFRAVIQLTTPLDNTEPPTNLGAAPRLWRIFSPLSLRAGDLVEVATGVCRVEQIRPIGIDDSQNACWEAILREEGQS